MKNYSHNLHAPPRGIFCPNSVVVASLRRLYCDIHLAENLFQTRSIVL
ncbi:MAG: DUF6783 domain-containing protein [Ruminococcus sp.]